MLVARRAAGRGASRQAFLLSPPPRRGEPMPQGLSQPLASASSRTPGPLQDRPAARPFDLSGTYARSGATLRRSDGRVLTVCRSSRPVVTARDSERYVRTAAPGVALAYAGNLYAAPAPGADDLDGCQFQDKASRTRYALALVAPDAYAVAPVPRSRPRARLAP